MKSVRELTFGFSDAENYRRRENKDLFNRIFLRTDALDRIQDPGIFFVVGEKGTGKTAYAVYLSNSPTERSYSRHKFIRETDYQKFLFLKNQYSLQLSDYVDIWKVIILLLVCKEIYDSATMADKILQYGKLERINNVIDAYYSNAFSPEIKSALQVIEDTKAGASIVAGAAGVKLSISDEVGLTKTRQRETFQTNLLALQREMESALRELKLPKSFNVFIDGIDIRPNGIPFSEYQECVRGLANAAWSLNNDFFPDIRDSKGRIKAITLLRPDIFNSLGLQNRNTKLKDNSVVLNWVTDYDKHRSSELFYLADRLFSSQQELPPEAGACWDSYFPFNASSLSSSHVNYTSFIVLLRYSYHRPRDILTILDIAGSLYKKNSGRVGDFNLNDFMSPLFKETYGNYLLGEIKDSLAFYYDEEEFELFLKFFEFLQGNKKFDYAEYKQAFGDFAEFINNQDLSPPDFMRHSDEFIQFLYDQNIISFIEPTEDENFIRWCFRERSLTNISPKVKLGMTYEIHYGLANTLNTGKKFVKPSVIGSKRNVSNSKKPMNEGRIIGMVANKKFGFIKQEGLPVDIYFSTSDLDRKYSFEVGQKVCFELEKSAKKTGGLVAKNISKI
ncbi:MAG: hypothetical protein ABJN75_00075 [Hoeflea sp.]|uniref:P-loop ATPase, Sll1717 family n=1 Tax=Hoeflea sp. TaxID=1940281 RepID=UPI0032987280